MTVVTTNDGRPAAWHMSSDPQSTCGAPHHPSVLSIEEFSVEDCEHLQQVLSTITTRARDVYLLENINTNPEVLLHEHVTSWFRLMT